MLLYKMGYYIINYQIQAPCPFANFLITSVRGK